MGKLIDLTGQRFGRLTVLGRSENQGKQTTWSCKCDCGRMAVVRGDHLREGATQSCGCWEETYRNSGMVHLVHGGRTPDCSRFGVGCVSVATILAVQLIKIMVGVVSKCALNGRIFPFFEIGHFHMDMQMTLALTA